MFNEEEAYTFGHKIAAHLTLFCLNGICRREFVKWGKTALEHLFFRGKKNLGLVEMELHGERS